MAPAVVLFDLDGVLEHEADLGLHDATGQVEEFARRLGAPISLDDCIESRRVSMQADMAMLALAGQLARRAGLHPHHYRGLPTLRAHLRQLDLEEEASDAT